VDPRFPFEHVLEAVSMDADVGEDEHPDKLQLKGLVRGVLRPSQRSWAAAIRSLQSRNPPFPPQLIAATDCGNEDSIAWRLCQGLVAYRDCQPGVAYPRMPSMSSA
jgi:hypothetical protein